MESPCAHARGFSSCPADIMRRAEKGNLGETLTSIPETKGLRRYLCVQGSGGEGCMVVPCIYNQRPQTPQPLKSCALNWGREARRGLGPSPLGGAVQCQPHPAGPALTTPHRGTPLRLPSRTPVPRFQVNLSFPTGGTEAATGYAAHARPPLPHSWGGWRQLILKPSVGKQVPHAPPNAVALVSAKAPVGVWALISPGGFPPDSPKPTRASPGGKKGRACREADGGSEPGSWHLTRSGTLRN